MTAIINFITGIADGIMALIEFIGGLIADILSVLQLIQQTLFDLPQYIAFLPNSISAIVLVMGGLWLIFIFVRGQ